MDYLKLINITNLATETGISYHRLYPAIRYRAKGKLTPEEVHKVCAAISSASIDAQKSLL